MAFLSLLSVGVFNVLMFKDDIGLGELEKLRTLQDRRGTGKWTAISALDYVIPVTLIGRCIEYILMFKDDVG